MVTKTAWLRRLMLVGLGAGAGLAMPPWHLVLLLFPAFVGLIWAVSNARRARDAFMAGWWFGLGHGLVGYYWVSSAFLVDAAMYGFLAPFAVAGLAAGLATFQGLTGFGAWWLWRWRGSSPLGKVVSFAAVGAGVEWLRAWVLTGFPWNLVATVWTFSPEMLQAVSVIGPFGLGLLSVAVAGLPALFVLGSGHLISGRGHLISGRGRLILGRGRWHARWAMCLGLVLLMAVWGAGHLRLKAAPGWAPGAATGAVVEGVRLRLIQPHIDQHLKWRKDLRIGHVRKQLRMSRDPVPPTRQPPTHVIWAETAVPYNLAADAPLRRVMAGAVPASGLLITGAPRVETGADGQRRAYNAIHALDTGGNITATYDKRHLVPFGEYVPFPWILRFSKLTAGRVDFHSGTTPRVFDLAGLPPVAMLICYEMIFPGEVRAIKPRPGWLLNVTNDAWFGTSAGPHQHLAAAQLRAAELGLPVVRVANTGISAVIDAHGRIRERLELGRDGILDAALPEALPPTPYARFGMGVSVLLFVAGLFASALPAGRQNHLARAKPE